MVLGTARKIPYDFLMVLNMLFLGGLDMILKWFFLCFFGIDMVLGMLLWISISGIFPVLSSGILKAICDFHVFVFSIPMLNIIACLKTCE